MFINDSFQELIQAYIYVLETVVQPSSEGVYPPLVIKRWIAAPGSVLLSIALKSKEKNKLK